MKPLITTPLTGKALLQKVKELSNVPRRETAKACGYVTTAKDNKVRVNFDPTGDESWYIMTNVSIDLSENLAQLYSLRNWIEYGFKQVKNELGWADFRLTNYQSIERWWEIIFSAYLLVSIHATYFQFNHPSTTIFTSELSWSSDFQVGQHSHHPHWESDTTWKSALNNLRLIIQPYIFYCLIQPWLTVFSIPGMKRCFLKLIDFMNDFRASPLNFPIAS